MTAKNKALGSLKAIESLINLTVIGCTVEASGKMRDNIQDHIDTIRKNLGGWQPIETAPHGEQKKPETHFIGMRMDGKRMNVATCYKNKHGTYEWWGGGMSPTYWQHLITAPEDNP